MAIEGVTRQSKTETFGDLHILNSSGNIIVDVIRRTLARASDAEPWAVERDEIINRVMINDLVRIDPATKVLHQGVANRDTGAVEFPAGTVPALSYLMGTYAAQWTAIGGFVDATIAANGYHL
jgi:hypothetical protein